VIIHSGQFATQTLEQAEDTGRSLSKSLNCSDAPGVLELKCMRAAAATDIVKAMPGGHDGGGSINGPRHFLPVVDQWLLPAPPLEIIRQGKHHHVPVLIGNAVEETSWIYFPDSYDIHTEQDYRKRIHQDYGSIAAQLLRLYPSNDFIELVPDYVEVEGALRLRPAIRPSPRKAYNAISADRWFLCPARSLLQALSVSQSEFVGRFLSTHALPGPIDYLGASHGYDVVTVFGTFGALGDGEENTPTRVTPTPDELALTVKFQKTWADFARSGNPGEFWSRYDAAQDNYVMFNKPMSSGTQLRKAQCDYWYPDDKPAPYAELKDITKPRVVNEGSLPPSILPYRNQE
jgi:para-nitrobenzyl esterase